LNERKSMSNLYRYKYKPDQNLAFYASKDGGLLNATSAVTFKDVH